MKSVTKPKTQSFICYQRRPVSQLSEMCLLVVEIIKVDEFINDVDCVSCQTVTSITWLNGL